MKKLLWIPVLIVLLFVVGCKNAATPTPPLPTASFVGDWNNVSCRNIADRKNVNKIVALKNIRLTVSDVEGEEDVLLSTQHKTDNFHFVTNDVEAKTKDIYSTLKVKRSTGNTYIGEITKENGTDVLFTDFKITFSSDARTATGSFKKDDNTYDFEVHRKPPVIEES